MHLPEYVQRILQTLEDAGFAAYLAGGCVRDSLLGLVPHDYDMTTNAAPSAMAELFGVGCDCSAAAFGTVIVEGVEITTFRKEGTYTDARHPETVTFTDSLEEDLARRDFTCNAMAFSPKTGLIDPFGGQEDLQKGILRCVGVPQKRFREDALRILRGLRFLAKFGFTADPLTHAAMLAEADRLSRISPQRCLTELKGMLVAPHVTDVLLTYGDVLAVLIPEISPCIAFSQHSRHHDFTVWEHTARAVGVAPPLLEVRLTMLLHDLAKPCCFTMDARGGHFKGHADIGAKQAERIMRRLCVEESMRLLVEKLIRLHRNAPTTLPDVRRLAGMLTAEEISLFIAVLEADRCSKKQGEPETRAAIDKMEAWLAVVRQQGLCCRLSELAVRGSDLVALGLQGPEIGRTLYMLLDAVIEGRCENDKQQLLGRITM